MGAKNSCVGQIVGVSNICKLHGLGMSLITKHVNSIIIFSS